MPSTANQSKDFSQEGQDSGPENVLGIMPTQQGLSTICRKPGPENA